MSASRAAVLDRTPKREADRQYRDLTSGEKIVRAWIMNNYGVLSRIAREFNCSVQWVQRIAYNREARSKGLAIEKKLKALGCPLQQRL